MATHQAVVTVAKRAPLEIRQIPTPTPTNNELLILNQWTANTPLDLQQADGGLLVDPPQILGDTIAGTVVACGPSVSPRLKVGDRVFGFTWRSQKEKAHQEYVCASENLVGKVPDAVPLEEAVTLPDNFVTVFHMLVTNLGLTLPWPKPEGFVPEARGKSVLVWGGSSSVGQYALQILRYYGYGNEMVATASKRNFQLVRECGASEVFDYGDEEVGKKICAKVGKVDLVLDCIGNVKGSVRPISEIVTEGAKVAILMPMIVRDASEEVEPEYTMAVQTVAEWKEGVAVSGVRTHFYLEVSCTAFSFFFFPLLY